MLVTILTDASVCPHTGGAGYGCWMVSERGRHITGAKFKMLVTNVNLAEMQAACNGVAIAYDAGILCDGDHILLQSDSLSAIGGFKGTRDLIVAKEHACAEWLHSFLLKRRMTISFKHVKGHSSVKDRRSFANRRCDEVARKYMLEERERVYEQRRKNKKLLRGRRKDAGGEPIGSGC